MNFESRLAYQIELIELDAASTGQDSINCPKSGPLTEKFAIR